jgi:hypothetical protein
MKIFLTSLIVVFLCFGIYTLFAEYQIKGSLSAAAKSSTENGNFHIASRVGGSISGRSGNSSIRINSGFGSFGRAVRAGENSEIAVSAETLTGDNERLQNVPTEFRLYENYPNPFNPATTIRFDIPRATAVTIRIYDIRGQEVASFLNGKNMEPGSYEMQFDASGLSTGIYIYRITAGAYQNVKKMMLMK